MCNFRSFALCISLWMLSMLGRVDGRHGDWFDRRRDEESLLGCPTHTNTLPQYTPFSTTQLFPRTTQTSDDASHGFGRGIGIGIIIGVLVVFVLEGLIWLGYRTHRKNQELKVAAARPRRPRPLQLPTPSEPLDFRHLEHYAMSTHSMPSPTTSTASLLRVAHRRPDGSWYFSEPGTATPRTYSPRQSLLSQTDESGIPPSRMYIQPLPRPDSIPPVPPIPPMPPIPEAKSPKSKKVPPSAFHDKYSRSQMDDDNISTRTGPPPYRG